MRTRPLYLVALLLALLGLAAYLVVPPAIGRRDRAALASARRIAAAVPDLPGAKARTGDCHGDGVVRCTGVARPVDTVADEAAAALRAQGHDAVADCSDLPFTSVSEVLRSCHISVPTGRGHAAWVWVSGDVRRVDGKPRLVGSLVHVSAT